MDCSLPGSSLHGILQARVLEWVAISFSRGSSRPRDRTRVSRIPGRGFNLWATREVICICYTFCNCPTRRHRQVASVVSDSVRPHGLQPTRLLRPWDSPDKNTGVGCHFLLQLSHSFCFCFFSILFSVCISVWGVYKDISSCSVILALAMSSLLMSPSKTFFILVQWFSFLRFPLDIFLEFPPLCLHSPCSLACYLLFSIGILTKVINILKPLSDYFHNSLWYLSLVLTLACLFRLFSLVFLHAI